MKPETEVSKLPFSVRSSRLMDLHQIRYVSDLVLNTPEQLLEKKFPKCAIEDIQAVLGEHGLELGMRETAEVTKLTDNPPGNQSPLVKWFVADVPLGTGEIKFAPPPIPKGFESGYWVPENIGRMGNNRACVKWVFHPGPDDRDRLLFVSRALEELLRTLEEHSLLQMKDRPTAMDGCKYIWEYAQRWIEAYRGY